MFKSFWCSNQQPARSRPQEISSDNSPSGNSSSGTSHPGTPGASVSSSFSAQKPVARPYSSSAEAAGIISLLKDKSVDELRKLLSDKDACQNLLLSLELVKTENSVKEELRNATLQLAKENLEKEPQILELLNQSKIIQTTELAAAQEKLHELQIKKGEMLTYNSPASLLYQLQESMNKTEEESEFLHRQLLVGEIDLSAFLQKYKKLRYSYHKRALTHLAAKTSLTG